jgi:hypothetical protein
MKQDTRDGHRLTKCQVAFSDRVSPMMRSKLGWGVRGKSMIFTLNQILGLVRDATETQTNPGLGLSKPHAG